MSNSDATASGSESEDEFDDIFKAQTELLVEDNVSDDSDLSDVGEDNEDIKEVIDISERLCILLERKQVSANMHVSKIAKQMIKVRFVGFVHIFILGL